MRTAAPPASSAPPAVRLGDRAHDRQAEPGAAAGAGLVAAGEALERAPGELRREAGPSSATSSSTAPAAARARRVIVAAPWRSALSTRLPSAWREPQLVGVQREARPAPRRDRAPVLGGAVGEAQAHAARAAPRPRAARGRTGSAPSPARASTSRSSASCARWSHSRRRPPAPRARRGSAGAAAQRALQLGLDHRDRRAQLVAGVGDEAPLALVGAPQPVEHRVERLAEPADLVVRGRQRQRLGVAVERDAAARRAHRLDRAQPGRRQRVAEQRTTSTAIGPPIANERASPASVSSRSSSDCPTTTIVPRRAARRARARVAVDARDVALDVDLAPPAARASSAPVSAGAARAARAREHPPVGAPAAARSRPRGRPPSRPRPGRTRRRPPRAPPAPVSTLSSRSSARRRYTNSPAAASTSTIASANSAARRTRIGTRLIAPPSLRSR